KKISNQRKDFHFKLANKICSEIGSIVQKIDRYYPSSQICHVCGTKNPETKNLAVREWICAKCKTSHDRDRNAAINIWKVGASTFFGEI
ncbi:transposase, partial [Megamonas funiformis]